MSDQFKDFMRIIPMVQWPILGLAQRGMPSSEIPEFAIRALRPYVDHPVALNLLPESVLMTTLARVGFLQRQPWMFEAYESCLELYRAAEAAAGKASLDICRKWAPKIRRCEALLFSNVIATTYDEDLGVEDAAVKAFRSIGSATENLIQTHLRELLDQAHLLGRPQTQRPIESKEFGVVVNDLLQSGCVPASLLQPDPWKVRLNQWRNIAQHATWQVTGDSVKCWYGRWPDRTEFQLTGDDLSMVESTVTNVMFVLGAARAIFLFDRLEPLVELVREDVDQRHSVDPISEYAKAVASYGFEITEFKVSEEEARVVVRDSTDQDPTHRRAYVVSFAYHLCRSSGRACAQVTYLGRDGIPNLQARVRAEHCASVDAGDWEKLLPYVDFTDLKSGQEFRIPPSEPPA